MTANAFDEDRQRCLTAGMDDYLTKPVERRALYEALLRWLDPSAPESSVTPALEPLPRRSGTDWSVANPVLPRASSDAAKWQSVSEGPLDEHVITALAADLSDELMPVVMSTFIEEAAQRLDAIARAAAVGDAALAGEEGHSLKGSAASFGASALRETAFAIEEAGRIGSIDGVRANIDALRSRGEAVITELRERFCTEAQPD
jgi:HPt (histidine-containing phosphotransfer) domain-containing protein